MARVLIVHWRPEEAAAHLSRLRARGHRARVIAPGGLAGLRELRERPPDAVVIDLSRLPAQGGAVGVALRQGKATRGVPLVFVGGEAGKTARVRSLLPDASFTSPAGLAGALRRALAAAPKGRPVVPDTMAGYSGTPLPKKLGIKAGSSVALLGAPSGFRKTLGRLPEGARVQTYEGRPFSVGILFVRSQADLARRFGAAARAMGDPGALWIVWPKQASGLATDLGGNEVRAFGLAAGLVDYKIAAIDATWSGLCFARRRAKR
jgi:CheY-like chemotaxis protein